MKVIPVGTTGFESTQLLGDVDNGRAILIDPPAECGPWLRECEALGLTIRHVMITGQVERNLLGYRDVIAATGAQLFVNERASKDENALQLHSGDVLEFGDLRITVEVSPDGAMRLNLTPLRSARAPAAKEISQSAPR